MVPVERKSRSLGRTVLSESLLFHSCPQMGKSQVLGEPKRWQSVLQQLSPSPELKPPPHLWVSLAAETRISDPTDVGISGL